MAAGSAASSEVSSASKPNVHIFLIFLSGQCFSLPLFYLLFATMKLRRVFNIAVTIFCLICLVLFCHRIWVDRDSICASFATFFYYKWLIFVEVLLMGVNIFIESLRWSVLRKVFTSGSYADDLTATLRSISLGNMTFANIGEHVGRFLSYRDKKSAGAASLVASIIQSASIVISGGVALAFLNSYDFVPQNILYISLIAITVAVVVGVIIILIGLRYFHFPAGWGRGVSLAFALNIVKFFVFSFQLALLLTPGTLPDALIFACVVLYYFFVTIVPRINIIDIGVKGGLATWMFCSFAQSSVISSAIIFIWDLNIVFPSLFGFFSFLHRHVS